MRYKYLSNKNDTIVLGVRINDLNEDDVMKRVRRFLASRTFNLIFTPNPEICLKATRDEHYQKTLNSSDLNIPDGVGLKLGAEILDQKINNRLTGVDLTKNILKFCNQAVAKTCKILILNRPNPLSSAKLIRKHFEKNYPRLLVNIIETRQRDTIIRAINDFEPTIIFAAFGAPEQEKLLLELKQIIRVKSVRLGVAVGGTFDFLTGQIKRAPQWWRDLGLEWFYRLLKQPKRLGRITDATIKFPLTCYRWNKRLHTTMRPNVLAIIRRGDTYLIQRNIRFKGEHWQFPQGGIDPGEAPERAVIREASEELGLAPELLRVNKKLPYEHAYIWPRWRQLLGGYRGQSQKFFLLDFLGHDPDITLLDSDEVGEIKWVKKSELLKYIHPLRQKSLKKIWGLI